MTNRKITVKNAFGGKAMNILGTEQEQLQNELETLRLIQMVKKMLKDLLGKTNDTHCKHALKNVDYMILETSERIYHIHTDIEFEKAMKVKNNE